MITGTPLLIFPPPRPIILLSSTAFYPSMEIAAGVVDGKLEGRRREKTIDAATGKRPCLVGESKMLV